MKTWTVDCSGGCGATVPALIEDLVWTCPTCSPDPGWPAPDEPCSDDLNCDRICWNEGSGFVYEGTRGGNGYALEDVQYSCWCEHHGVKR